MSSGEGGDGVPNLGGMLAERSSTEQETVEIVCGGCDRHGRRACWCFVIAGKEAVWQVKGPTMDRGERCGCSSCCSVLGPGLETWQGCIFGWW